jgi:hypothetical protein
MLKSTRVRYLSKQGRIPYNTKRLAPGEGAPCRIKDVTFKKAMATSAGLLGLFEDDAGENYFMLANLQHTRTGSAKEMTLAFTIHFEPDVRSVYRLSRTPARSKRCRW